MKMYRGCRIEKLDNGEYMVGGFIHTFETIADAKGAIDMAIAEEQALSAIDSYVNDVIGGWL